MSPSRTDAAACLLLFLLSLLVFTRGLSIHGLEYRDDEIFYFKSTREMARAGEILSPTYFGEDRFQKPILYYWLVLLSYRIFGVNWFAARFVAAMFAGWTVCLTWLIGKTLFNRRVASLAAVILMTVPLFFRHAKDAVPDMPLDFFIVGAAYCAVRVIQNATWAFGGKGEGAPSPAGYSVLFFVSCALGFMVKGFAAVIVPVLTVVLYSVLRKKPGILAAMRFGRGALIMLFITCPWFFYMIKAHGWAYLNYMLVDETKNRLVGGAGGHVLLNVAATFFDHVLFYLGVLGSYFAPWCIFLAGALPLAFLRVRSAGPTEEGLRLMLIWFLVVFCFFSMMYFSINHYMLVLTTPFALLVSYFFLENIGRRSFLGKVVLFLRKYAPLVIMTVGTLAFGFVFVFLAGAAKWWLAVFLLIYSALAGAIHKSSRPMTAPLALGVFMLCVFAQSPLLAKAGLTSHAVLQKFAVTIDREESGADSAAEAVIAVGSHDIHEKEFQVYFDRRVVKAAGSTRQETGAKLNQLFATDKKVYCLMTQKDFGYFLMDSFPRALEVVQEDYIFRRRMNIGKGFFTALLRLDRTGVRRYLKEKLVLVRKEPDA